MKKLSIICAFAFFFGLMASPVFAAHYCKDYLETENPGGWGSSLKTWDEEVIITPSEDIYVDIWMNDCPGPAIGGGFYLIYGGPISLKEVLRYNDGTKGWDDVGTSNLAELAGPWAPTASGNVHIADPPPVGLHLVITLGENLPTGSAPDGDGDIIIARLKFHCDGGGDGWFNISTKAGPYWGPSPPWDEGLIPDNTFTIHQEAVLEEICDNGVDDDGDTLVDCEDIEDCEGEACNDELYCTLTDICEGGECVGTGSPCPPFDNPWKTECDEVNDICVKENVLVDLIMIPDATTVPRGGNLGITVAIKNNTGKAGSVYFATKVRVPSGSIYPPYLFGPLKVDLAAHQAKQGKINQSIPGSAPLGVYTYYGIVVIPGMGTLDLEEFDFQVVAPTGEVTSLKKWESTMDEVFAEE